MELTEDQQKARDVIERHIEGKNLSDAEFRIKKIIDLEKFKGVARRLRNSKKGWEFLNAMLDRQNKSCAICLSPFPGMKKFQIDHDHKTGEIRGLLCWRCNLVIGQVCERKDILGAMISYLK